MLKKILPPTAKEADAVSGLHLAREKASELKASWPADHVIEYKIVKEHAPKC